MSNSLNTWFMREVFVQHALLRNFFARRRPRQDVDDLCQETYLRIFEAYSAQRRPIPKSLLFRIARNLLIDLRQHARVRLEYIKLVSDQHVIDAHDPERCVHAMRECRSLGEALRSLGLRQRQVLWMRRVHEVPIKVIAVQLRIAPHTVEQTVRVALHRTRTQMTA